MSTPPWLVRRYCDLYRLALRTFPARFREQWGEEMEKAFRSHCEAGRGVFAGLGRAVHGLGEVVMEGVRERRDGGRRGLERKATAEENGMHAGNNTGLRARGLEALVADGRFAVRALRRTPGFSIAVVGVLALGIASSVALFTLVDALVFRGLPFDDGDELVAVIETYQEPGGPLEERGASYPAYEDWTHQTTSFAALAVRDFRSLALATEGGPAQAIGVALASSALPEVLGVSTAFGRWYTAGEEDAAARVVVLSHALWRARFGEDESVVGGTLRLEGVPFEIIGVAQAGFAGAFGGVDGWVPFRSSVAFMGAGATGDFDNRGARGYLVLGRLHDGVTVAAAQEQIDRVTAGLHASGAQAVTRAAQVQSFRDRYLGDARRDAVLLFGAAGLLLLIACANVANLMLARQLVRRREIALRRALGARHGDVVRQLLVESVLLGLAGGAVGATAAPLLMRVLGDANLGGLPDYIAPSINGLTIVFAVAVSLLTAIAFGAIPAAANLRIGLLEALQSARGASGGTRPALHARRILVVAQMGIAVPLLAGAGLLLQSIARQTAIDPGYNAAGVVGAQISLPGSRYTRDDARTFTTRLAAQLGDNAALTDVAIASDIPIQSGYRATMVDVEDPGRAPREFRVYLHNVSVGYFELLGMRLVDGRTFEERDGAGSAEVVVLSETAARRFWPGERAVGRMVDGAEVIGVVGDGAFRTLLPDPVGNPDDPDIFLSFAQFPTLQVSVLARATSTAPEAVARQVEEAVNGIDPSLPVQTSVTLTDVLESQTAASRALARELVAFALAALLLAAAGLYGIMTYAVSQQAGEIGVRMALGAGRQRVMRQILRQGLSFVAIGTTVGLGIALAGGRLIQSQLYGVRASDPLTFLAVSGVLFVVGAIACAVPARRATRFDPVRVLRES
jgi:predicted permease